jgi:hypothetical protein
VRGERAVYNEIDVWLIGAWNKRLVEHIGKSCIFRASHVVCIYDRYVHHHVCCDGSATKRPHRLLDTTEQPNKRDAFPPIPPCLCFSLSLFFVKEVEGKSDKRGGEIRGRYFYFSILQDKQSLPGGLAALPHWRKRNQNQKTKDGT